MAADTLIQERVCVCHLYTITHAEPERVKNPCAKHGRRSTAMERRHQPTDGSQDDE